MTRGPRRLLDDPDFKWETGCDLADERSLVGTYDLEGSKKKLLAAIALPLAAGGAPDAAGSAPGPTIGDGTPAVRAGSRWAWFAKPAAVVVAGAGAIAGAFWLGMQTGTDPGVRAPVQVPPVESRVEAPVEPQVAPAAVAPTEAPAVLPTPSEEAPPALPQDAPRSTARPLPVDPVLAPSSDAVAVAVAEEPVVVLPDPAADGLALSEVPAAATAPLDRGGFGGAIQAQTELMNQAGDALDDEDHERARDLYRRLLADWPNGAAAPDAKLGLLQALRALGDTAAVESLTAEMQDHPDFRTHREEILRLRAESLVVLNRCDEALLISEALPTRESVEIRRSCRRRE